MEFLKNKEIQVDRVVDDAMVDVKIKDFNKLVKKMRKLMIIDKDFFIKGSKAFVSFMRSYKEHKLASIFKLDELDLPEIARSFFLFKIPFIKEIKETTDPKNKIATDHELELLSKVEFKNKNQENMIQEKIKNDRQKSKEFFKFVKNCKIWRNAKSSKKGLRRNRAGKRLGVSRRGKEPRRGNWTTRCRS